MKISEMIGLLLVFLIAFALGYMVSFPSNLDIEIELDDNFVEVSENLENMTMQPCPSCVCECKTDSGIYWDNYYENNDNWIYVKNKGEK